MCSRGVYQLTKMSLYFCDFGGSSSGVRNLLMSNQLKQFMNNNPQINFDFICKRNHHPYVSGSYINGYKKSVPLRSLQQQQVLQKLLGLKNQLGRSSFQASGTRVYGATKSIQGLWQPNTFNKYPIAQLQKTHKIPWVKVQKKQKMVVNKQILKEKDIVNQTLKIRSVSDGNFRTNKGHQL